MRRLVHAVCLAVLALAFVRSEAAAQPGRRRVGIPRPGPGQPTQPGQPAPPTPSASPGQPAAQTASASQYKPAIEYQSFMQLRFYENQGGSLVEDLEVVFPPPGSQKASFVVSKAGGEVLTTVPLRLESPLASYTVFGMFKPNAVSGLAPVGEPGDYVLSVQIDGQ